MPFSPNTIAKAMIGGLPALALLGALVSAPAMSDEPPRVDVDLAAKLLDVVGLKSTVDSVVPYMLAELERGVVASHPEMKNAMHETVVSITPEFVKTEANVLSDVARVMASQMSDAELKETLAFFQSGAGKKYLAAQSPMLRQLDASATAWRQQLSNTILPRVREEMKKKGFEF